MQSTNERIKRLKEQERLMDYTAEVKLAIYYDLVGNEECEDKLIPLENDYNLSVKHQGQTYTPYKSEKNQNIVFANHQTTFQGKDQKRVEKTFILVLPEDYKRELEDLKAQDEQLNKKYLQVTKIDEPTNKTRIFVLIMAWIGVSLGIVLTLEMLEYNVPGGLLILIGSLSSAAILFALAEIIKLLESKQKS
jgi:hypothetical protein